MVRIRVNRATMSRTKQYRFHCDGCGFDDQFILTTKAEGVNVNRHPMTIMMDLLFGTGSEKAQLRARAAAEAELKRTQGMVACPKCKRPRASKLPEYLRIGVIALFLGLLWLVVGWLLAMLLVSLLFAFGLTKTGVVALLLSYLVMLGVPVFGMWRYVKARLAHLRTLDERASFWTINPERWNAGVGDGGVLAQR